MALNPDLNSSSSYGMNENSEAIRQLNSLLRGELSAAETYRMAIDEVAKDKVSGDVATLRLMQEEHSAAAQKLRQCIRAMGGEPSESSGAWGAWAQTVQGTANLFGDVAALKSLKEGEEHGLKDYREALDDVDAGSANMIQAEMIPQQRRHISLLDQLINSTGRA